MSEERTDEELISYLCDCVQSANKRIAELEDLMLVHCAYDDCKKACYQKDLIGDLHGHFICPECASEVFKK